MANLWQRHLCVGTDAGAREIELLAPSGVKFLPFLIFEIVINEKDNENRGFLPTKKMKII